MDSTGNRAIYRAWAPFYDMVFQPVFSASRAEMVQGLALQPGERLLIPGAGTGQDLPWVPAGVQIFASDFSPTMLVRAQAKASQTTCLQIMDAQSLAFPDASFDAVALTLTLSVVPNGRAAFGEAWRVLKPGGRVAIFDKFLPEGQPITPIRRLLGRIIRALGTDPNRRLTEYLTGWEDLVIERTQPGLLDGQYQFVWLRKAA